MYHVYFFWVSLFFFLLLLPFYKPQPTSIWQKKLNIWENMYRIKATLIIGITIIITYFLFMDYSHPAWWVKPSWKEMLGMHNAIERWYEWPYRIFTKFLVHQTPGHIGLNLFGLLYMSLYERRVGWKRYLCVLFFCGIFSSPVVFSFDEFSTSIGISAGIFGLLGAYLTDDIRLTWQQRLTTPLLLASYIIAVNLLSFFSDGTWFTYSDMAHFLGLCGGVLFVMLFPNKQSGKITYREAS